MCRASNPVGADIQRLFANVLFDESICRTAEEIMRLGVELNTSVMVCQYIC